MKYQVTRFARYLKVNPPTVFGILAVAVAGAAVPEGYALLIVAGICLIAGALLAFVRRGALLALLLLGAMNGIPFISTAGAEAGQFALQDLAAIALILTSVYWLFLDPPASRLPGRFQRTLFWAGWLLFAWWVIVVGSSAAFDDVPFVKAAIYGRDFAVFAALLICLPRVRLCRRDIRDLVVILAVATSVYALGQILATTGLAEVGGLIHYASTFEQSGLTRLYGSMIDLVQLGLCLSLAACLLSRTPTVRNVSLLLVLLFLTSIAVQLTRARWIGLILAFVLLTVWILLSPSGSFGRANRVRRRHFIFVCAATVALLLVFVTDPGLLSGGTVFSRLTSIFGDLNNGTGTVASRQEAAHISFTILGEHWLAGLGFIPPSARYVMGLPGGSIRDSDLGVLNAVMTMGVIGAVLIYLPAFSALTLCLKADATRPSTTEFAWIRYGGALWLLSTLISSVTLITLFSLSGLVMTAVFLAVLAQPQVCGQGASAMKSTHLTSFGDHLPRGAAVANSV